MKRFKVSFRPQAETDLFGLYDYVAQEADRAVAGAYIDRIEAACMALETFPNRGTRRDDIRQSMSDHSFREDGQRLSSRW